MKRVSYCIWRRGNDLILMDDAGDYDASIKKPDEIFWFNEVYQDLLDALIDVDDFLISFLQDVLTAGFRAGCSLAEGHSATVDCGGVHLEHVRFGCDIQAEGKIGQTICYLPQQERDRPYELFVVRSENLNTFMKYARIFTCAKIEGTLTMFTADLFRYGYMIGNGQMSDLNPLQRVPIMRAPLHQWINTVITKKHNWRQHPRFQVPLWIAKRTGISHISMKGETVFDCTSDEPKALPQVSVLS